MNNLEKNTVRIVAKLSPWLAPFPSAFFVARSSMIHLTVPLPVAVIMAAIVESLGVTTVHSALWFWDWNQTKRKTDPTAPVALALAALAVYFVTTLFLVVFLEVWPSLSVYAPALFPVVAMVGAANIASIAHQERREAAVRMERAEAKAERDRKRSQTATSRSSERPSEPVIVGQIRDSDRSVADSLTAANSARRSGKEQALTALLTFYSANPGASYRLAAEAVNRSKPWVVAAVAELEAAGKVRRNGRGVEVVTG